MRVSPLYVPTDGRRLHIGKGAKLSCHVLAAVSLALCCVLLILLDVDRSCRASCPSARDDSKRASDIFSFRFPALPRDPSCTYECSGITATRLPAGYARAPVA